MAQLTSEDKKILKQTPAGTVNPENYGVVEEKVPGEGSVKFGVPKEELEAQRADKWHKTRRLAQAARLGAKLTGHGDLAEGLHLASHGAHAAEKTGQARSNAVGNIAGSQASKFAQGKGLGRKGYNLADNQLQKRAGKSLPKVGTTSAGKSSALGGAVAAAVSGEGVGGIAKGALSWYLLYIAFGALVTVVGFVPALLYLNFHYLMSKLGSKVFGTMTYWQKAGLLLANLAALAAVMIIFAIIGSFFSLCNSFTGKIMSTVGSFVGVIPADICKAFKFGGGSSGGGGASDSFGQQCSQTLGSAQSPGCQVLSSCVNISSYTTTHDCASNGGTCLASPAAATKIQSFINTFNSLAGSTGCTLRISSSVQVNGGPSGSSCHAPGRADTGTCVDFNLLPGHDACYQKFYQAAQSSGAVRSFLDEYVSSCMPSNATGGNIHVNF